MSFHPRTVELVLCVLVGLLALVTVITSINNQLSLLSSLRTSETSADAGIYTIAVHERSEWATTTRTN